MVANLVITSEWILDNYYIIRQANLQIAEDLTTGFYYRLPKLVGGPMDSQPRIFGLAREILKFQNHLLKIGDLQQVLIQIQDQVPLSMAELWALPIFLRLSLIEYLAHLLARAIKPPVASELPVLQPFCTGSIDLSVSPQDSALDSAVSGVVANIILSLRTISEQNWNDFFESVSYVEVILRKDPTGQYAKMDFKTRDLYRKQIEKLAQAAGMDEITLALHTLDLAREQISHIGFFLLGKDRTLLEAKIGYHPDLIARAKSWSKKNTAGFYLGGIGVLSLSVFLLGLSLIGFPAVLNQLTWSGWLIAFLIVIALVIPTLTTITSLVNWLVPLWIPPAVIPKLKFRNEVPTSDKTLVVIPTLIANTRDADNLVGQLEMNYLRNPEPGLLFALLSDFPDADQETLPDDRDLLIYLTNSIKKLNEKYQPQSTHNGTPSKSNPDQPSHQLFYLLHRKRQWNPGEGRWIGWERKRGKLQELNLLLRGGRDLSFITPEGSLGEISELRNVRFVITLDSDTVLPRGAAVQMVGALAHPLNEAVFNQDNEVVSGYTFLQPRMEIHPRSVNHSWFTRIFAGDTGLDLYSRAVSDVYQDLFSEGIFVGKGIYDVDGVERSVNQHIPENAILSHDLLEGILGRAGLVSDISLIEDFPSDYFLQINRLHRWNRGDWQLLPWLLRPGKFQVKLSAIDRWKIVNNLIRSLLSPSLLAVIILGVIAFPYLSFAWVGTVFLALGIPVLTGFSEGLLSILRGDKRNSVFRSNNLAPWRWLLAVAFLPYEAYISMDAIGVTLYRLFVSHRHLLEWTSSAQAARIFSQGGKRQTAWRKMMITSTLSVGLMVVIYSVQILTGLGTIFDLLTAAPLLILWLISPLIADRINRPITRPVETLDHDQSRLLRQVARQTWGFFERFAGPEDHWLPPDHYQEAPVGIVAHNTSPSNIGLLLTSTLAAHDFGYLDHLELATRLQTTVESLSHLERYRGHFLNWYDTVTLQPLRPRYVSTVDSGNLAACFIITAQACKTMRDEHIFRWELWQGYLDSLSLLSAVLNSLRVRDFQHPVDAIIRRIQDMCADILAQKQSPTEWLRLFKTATGPFWQDLTAALIKMISSKQATFDIKNLHKLQETTKQVERHHSAIRRTLNELVPWIMLLDQVPPLLNQSLYASEIDALKSRLPLNPVICKIDAIAQHGIERIQKIRKLVDSQPAEHPLDDSARQTALDWLDTLTHALDSASRNAKSLEARFAEIEDRLNQLVIDMDFRFLYDPQRRVFHIGFNLDEGRLDNNYYDLLASEARIASIISIAKGDVPQNHWLQLGRPLTKVENTLVLLSWSATMFEYLMPPLFLRSYTGTLLAESTQGAVILQMNYGKSRGVPWGISESGFYLFDANKNYQYRAFGVPGLGFKRGLSEDLVIAPYASIMAIQYAPQAVVDNLSNLIKMNCLGSYGFYESIDFTPSRLMMGETHQVIQEYMAHHQGMIMMSLVNFFHADIMVQRMHRDPRIQSVDLLLQEQIPQAAPLQSPATEETTRRKRPSAAVVEIAPWDVPIHTAIPQVNLISNGNYSVFISNMGGGYSTCRGVDLTRWRSDGVLDQWGNWIYIQELDRKETRKIIGKRVWSTTYQPFSPNEGNMKVAFYPHMAVFRRTDHSITTTTSVVVNPDSPVEIRRVHLHNTTAQPRRLRVTSYGEVVLAPLADDIRHPAFNKLFIESEFIPELNLLISTRRLRSNTETPVFLGHMLVHPKKGLLNDRQPIRHETDRLNFIGRGRSFRSPAALFSDEYLTGSIGNTQDPIFALGQEIMLGPLESEEIAFLTLFADSREALITLASQFSSWLLIERSFQQANLAAQSWLGRQNFDSLKFKNALQVLSALLYPFNEVRALPELLTANRLGQSGLWRFGISGDYPVLLIKLEDPQQTDLVREALQVFEYLRSRRFLLDVVIINYQQTNYGAELNRKLHRVISQMKCEQWLNKRGGIFILYADQIHTEELVLLQTTARFVLSGQRGTLNEQMPEHPKTVYHLPQFTASLPEKEALARKKPDPLPALAPLHFNNGTGGFSANGKEYIIDLAGDRTTPAPWINVIGYPNFGFMVSEMGSQCTWAVNSGENRLTPWSNDPVCDPTGEALYLRDEESGLIWSPTPLPAGDGLAYRVTHGAGYTTFDHHSNGLRQHLTLFASPEDPVKIIHLKLENTLDSPRRITATQYVEWVLGNHHAAEMIYIIPKYEPKHDCLLAHNPASPDFSERTAFLTANTHSHCFTADRTEFLGRAGTYASPAGLRRIGLERRINPGEDPCAAFQVHIDMLPGGMNEVYFVLGQGKNREEALALVQKYHQPAFVGAALERTRVFWDSLLGTIQVRTPEPAADILLNHWLLYQSLSCRVWGRSAFYQPSGAFGFRDQLQDVLAVLPIDPSIARGQIINAAQHQFKEGDVMHWWHPPFNRGVRTRVSDDLLWLPYVTAQYVETTGDAGILDQKIPFIDAPALNKDEHERYNFFHHEHKTHPLIEHCRRALAAGSTRGERGLPLIGAGDWNDGFNRVGIKGQGESVWLAWFLCDVLTRFADLCAQKGDTSAAGAYRAQARDYAAAIENCAWDGSWYRRAYYDDGTPLGTAQASECQIDSIAQSWAVLSGVGDPERARQAMQAVYEKLIDPEYRLSLLFTPPFVATGRDPGYIKGYPPGIRENGGQYTHAATWVAWAFAKSGDGNRAVELFNLLNPVLMSDSREKNAAYRVEPYVICADICGQAPHRGRGGWTWYTGSAAWMYRLGLEAILGFKKVGDHLQINPVIPENWRGFELRYRYQTTHYEILVNNPPHKEGRTRQIILDGTLLDEAIIPLVDDGKHHRVEVTL